ncbi:SE1561 family protein [Salimicrobium sp. PL1-032A]|uniref:SE1561 family protein n=1 Tax=Salimicrobium sp. PL1-032A TaxID=3095364 RepID=UPI00325FE07E
MGNALKGKDDQFSYIKNRVSMLNDVVESMEPPVDAEELKRVEDMIQSLNGKVVRFRQDRKEEE